MRRLVLDYAAQHRLADTATGLVDIGWTGRMSGSFIELCEAAGTGFGRPAVLFWGHEPRATGWTDPDLVAAWMYNTATGHGLQWRVPDAPWFVLRWLNSARSRLALGWEATIAWYERTLMTCHPANRARFQAELDTARRHEGTTLFDWIVGIILDHGPGGIQSEDQVKLELQ
jgi:hypothetical protein